MGLPPILSNLPVFKLFRPGGAEGADTAKKASAPDVAPKKQAVQDRVEISETARQKLETAHYKTTDNLDDIRQAAHETRDILENRPVSLGADPDFLIDQ